MRSLPFSSGSSVTVTPFKTSHENKPPDVFAVCQKHDTWITEKANVTHTIPYATSKEISSKVVIKSLKYLSTTTTKPSQAWKVMIFSIYILQQCPSRRKIRFIYFLLLLFCSLLHKNTTCQAAEYLQIYKNSVSSLNLLADVELLQN